MKCNEEKQKSQDMKWKDEQIQHKGKYAHRKQHL